MDILTRLYDVIVSRKSAAPESSYVASLFAGGPAKIAQKVGEEASETVIAAVQGHQESIIAESADLVFHLLVLWAAHGITPRDVAHELERREGTSGIREKQSRS